VSTFVDKWLTEEKKGKQLNVKEPGKSVKLVDLKRKKGNFFIFTFF